MLTALCIKNFTLVAKLDLDFAAGMSVFTGETGAGKSIMIDALILALGGRADATVVRPGAESCDIQACFICSKDSDSARWLAEHELEAEEEIFLRRTITREGRSKAYINGVVFPLQKVKELGVTLVHIHGQHEHQTLFSAATHREHLDQFAQHQPLRKQIKEAYQLCQRLQAAQTELASKRLQDNSHVLDNLKEWEALCPLAGEIEALHQEHQLLHHAADYATQAQMLLQLLQTDDGPSIRYNLQIFSQQLDRLPHNNRAIQNIKALIDQAQIVCDEAYDELEKFGDSLAMDPERLQQVEKRMSALHHLARKWQIAVEQLPEYGQVLAAEVAAQESMAMQQAQLAADYATAQQTYHDFAMALRASRITHAQQLALKITANIQQLGMPHGRIELLVSPSEAPQEHGMDKIEYRVATNPGMPPDLLSKIASGGELSRISLAIQLIAAQQGTTPTLFFDEVDVGIGGNTAAIVGRLLRKLGQRLQVFCVTHQPQVAASAHQHFLVEKHCEQGQTFSQIKPLSSEDTKVEELARMLGGLTITTQTRSHAKELLESLTG